MLHLVVYHCSRCSIACAAISQNSNPSAADLQQARFSKERPSAPLIVPNQSTQSGLQAELIDVAEPSTPGASFTAAEPDDILSGSGGDRLTLGIVKRDDDENMPGLKVSLQLRNNAHIAHGTVMSVAIVLFYPIGAIMMKLCSFRHLVRFNIAWQMAGMAVMLTCFGLGCRLSVLHNEVSGLLYSIPLLFLSCTGAPPMVWSTDHRILQVWTKTHEIFGTVIVGLFLVNHSSASYTTATTALRESAPTDSSCTSGADAS